MKRITVLLAENHTVVREGFRKLLEFEDDFEEAQAPQYRRTHPPRHQHGHR